MKYLKLIPSLLITAVIASLWYDSFIFLLVIVFFFWLFVPIAIAALYFTIKARRCRNTYEKVTVALGLLNLLFLSVTIAWLCSNAPSPERMAKHYDRHQDDIEQLEQYTRQSLDPGAYLHLEFERGKTSIFQAQGKNGSLLSQDWYDNNSIMNAAGLTQEEFTEIHRLLRQADCIGITLSSSCDDDSTAVVDWRRKALGMYSYILFDRPATPKEDSLFLADPMYIPYTDRVILQYSGGAIGPQTFPFEEKESFLAKHPPASPTVSRHKTDTP